MQKRTKCTTKNPQKEQSKNNIINAQRKTIRQLVKENKRLRNEVYDLNKVLERNIRRIEELSQRFSLEELMGIDEIIDKPYVTEVLDIEDAELTEADIDAIINGG